MTGTGSGYEGEGEICHNYGGETGRHLEIPEQYQVHLTTILGSYSVCSTGQAIGQGEGGGDGCAKQQTGQVDAPPGEEGEDERTSRKSTRDRDK